MPGIEGTTSKAARISVCLAWRPHMPVSSLKTGCSAARMRGPILCVGEPFLAQLLSSHALSRIDGKRDAERGSGSPRGERSDSWKTPQAHCVGYRWYAPPPGTLRDRPE